jgi:hypothetical protein
MSKVYTLFHMMCLRKIAGIKWQDLICNTTVLKSEKGVVSRPRRSLGWSGTWFP